MGFGSRIFRFFLAFFFVAQAPSGIYGQSGTERVTADTAAIGLSAVSIKTLNALSLRFEYPIQDYIFDTIHQLLFVSGKEKDEQSGQLLLKGFFGAIDNNEKPKWIVESSLFDFNLENNLLIVSNDERSARFNKLAGYDELKYPGRLLTGIENTPFALFYDSQNKEEVHCLDLRTGFVKWKAMVPGAQDWVDYKLLNDSVLLIAASGIHAVHVRTGLLWTVPLQTAFITAKALTYSLAKNTTILKVSKVVHCTNDENQVTQLASNILLHKGKIVFASKEKCLALDETGKTLWSLDLRNYPISKMMLTVTDSSLLLVNFGFAMHSNRFVNWGRPFILELNPENGAVLNQYDLSKIENMADFTQAENSLVFAGKDEILKVKPGEPEIKTMLALSQSAYGRFVEFINGNEYYTFKEGYYVPLNFINGNLIYFKTDNNKVYGIDGDFIQYEYHFTELFRLAGKFDSKPILRNEKKTILISGNYELMYELNTADPMLITENKLYFFEGNKVTVVNRRELE